MALTRLLTMASLTCAVYVLLLLFLRKAEIARNTKIVCLDHFGLKTF